VTDPVSVKDPDRELVRRFRAGEASAFVELMRRHERRVYNLAYRMLGGRDEALDATQETFLSCYRNLGRFRGDSTFSTWLHRVAVNACYDILRRRPPTSSLDSEFTEPPSSPDHADRAAASADVQRALMAVPPEFRTVLIMFEIQDLPIEEIAATLQVPPGTVKSRLHRGRISLGRALRGARPAGEAFSEPSPVGGPDEGRGEPAAPAGPSKTTNP
jgi:RNA polymerase sigma-70 factor, ECF subfamily